ncbi:unnamed protein product [Onchocerca flexuosa]|uniref:Uncharacterized protein n=1 Tax=Onchocerca flexuosa TaxID=387005 RepID=A0A3P7W7N0_9BILA|nr:unnamed protein product [Onchocerca flexuosa]
MPSPNSQFSTDAISYRQSLGGNSSERSSTFAAISAVVTKANSGKFFAPPPSAASLSTYGVVKPAGMRVHIQHGGADFMRNRRKQRHRARTDSTRIHSPPPSYSKIRVECSDDESQQLQVPTNSRIVSSIDSSSVESTRRILLPSGHFISSIEFAQQQHLFDYSSTSSDVSLR